MNAQQKTRYNDLELQKFRELIEEKIQKAQSVMEKEKDERAIFDMARL